MAAMRQEKAEPAVMMTERRRERRRKGVSISRPTKSMKNMRPVMAVDPNSLVLALLTRKTSRRNFILASIVGPISNPVYFRMNFKIIDFLSKAVIFKK